MRPQSTWLKPTENPMPGVTIDLLRDGPAQGPLCLVLAHGAGQGPRSPFMEAMTRSLGERGIAVARFAFPYMRRAEAEGRRRPPDAQPKLLEAWREVIAQAGLPPGQLVIGGKSLGGRIASLVADEAGVAGLVCLGYPFHPPGRPAQLRTAHLAGLTTPTLFCQGERDPFGNRAEVAGYALSPAIRIAWIEDGDHGFVPRKASGRSLDDNLLQATAAIAAFVDAVSSARGSSDSGRTG
jgi:predicted alpha/beta-hydrolase family hydrolase